MGINFKPPEVFKYPKIFLSFKTGIKYAASDHN